jgi:hypothetical protein
MEDDEKLNGTSCTGMFVVADNAESRFIWPANSGRKQGTEDLREPHRANSRFLGCLFSLPPKCCRLARPWPPSLLPRRIRR